jgi:hypothetical protein
MTATTDPVRAEPVFPIALSLSKGAPVVHKTPIILSLSKDKLSANGYFGSRDML